MRASRFLTRAMPRHWLAALMLSFVSAGEALALSCMPPTVESVFSYHRDHPGQFVMALGTVKLRDPLPVFNPKTLEHEPPGPLSATFEGWMARETGFDLKARLPILIERKCFNDVCGFLPLRSPAVLFLQREGEAFVLHTDYCSSTLLPDPSDEDIVELTLCLADDGCSEI